MLVQLGLHVLFRPELPEARRGPLLCACFGAITPGACACLDGGEVLYDLRSDVVPGDLPIVGRRARLVVPDP